VQVSSAYYVRASGDTTDDRGVLPDVAIKRAANDSGKEKDAVLDAAMDRCIDRDHLPVRIN
jgi:C-terminal processing protease CtpA/Prc